VAQQRETSVVPCKDGDVICFITCGARDDQLLQQGSVVTWAG
jgi:hypothetical protein